MSGYTLQSPSSKTRGQIVIIFFFLNLHYLSELILGEYSLQKISEVCREKKLILEDKRCFVHLGLLLLYSIF